jgi:hypothetical protein
VYPPSSGITILALLVFLMGAAFLVSGVLGYIEDWDWTLAAISVAFTLLGLTIYFMVGEVRLTDTEIVKRVLWMRESMTWGEVQSIKREQGQWQGWSVTSSSGVQLKISDGHVAARLMAMEIARRAPALRAE